MVRDFNAFIKILYAINEFNLDLAEKKTVLSRELRQSTVHLIDAGKEIPSIYLNINSF
jgi:hypothetical protein